MKLLLNTVTRKRERDIALRVLLVSFSALHSKICVCVPVYVYDYTRRYVCVCV